MHIIKALCYGMHSLLFLTYNCISLNIATTKLRYMKTDSKVPNTIDEYMTGFPEDVQEKLEALRATIRKAAPDAEEIISYGMPTFYLKSNLVHFAAFKNHIGFYPAPSGIEAFNEELSPYKTSKGAAQFPIDKPLPLSLVSKIVQYRVKQNLEKADVKARDKMAKSR